MNKYFEPFKDNLITDTDGYKLTHPFQYPEGLDFLVSYGEARKGGELPTALFIGMKPVVAESMCFKITDDMRAEAKEEFFDAFGVDYYSEQEEVWKKVQELGYIPMEIWALPEGTEVPLGTPLFLIFPTEKWFAPYVNRFETNLMHIWYPITIATNSLYIRRDLKPLVEKTGTPELLPYMVHDFGARGVTTKDQQKRGGMSHLFIFDGSDTMIANRYLNHFYHKKGKLKTVWATEHSVATAYGSDIGEFKYLLNQLNRTNPNSIFSIVIDSYDSDGFIDNVVGSDEIKEVIIKRPGRVVFRPDSGDAKTNILNLLTKLENIFGSTVNSKGYKVINHNVGLLQGDGMNRKTILELYECIVANGWSTDNLVVGSGGGLLQEGMTRDKLRFAIKGCFMNINGVSCNMVKNPKTDPSKASKAGLPIVNKDFTVKTVNSMEEFLNTENLLRPLWRNGEFLVDETFEEIIKKINF